LVRSVATLFGRALHTAWSEELLAFTYREGPVAFSIRSFDGELVDCNQRYLDLVGLTAREVRERSIIELVPHATAPSHGPGWQSLRDGELDRLEREFELLRGDGTSIWVRAHSV